ncbi:efflux RND transporter permease subunit [Anaeromyxobacter paludicola]|uniref:Membrane transport protein MMPL domain-containing protein n=1 Tax=Anaeromyxobacter paludicola TaxID=2918171 RepID=A0ABM7XG25_9BACT|nr:MMPL family transporter [Anaeromyxobacter paludicola]BDG10850.1 hypothetical protein AMPC_39630 [Anaeromyxobacter paludicola]
MREPRPSAIDRLTAASLAHPWKFVAGALALAAAGGLLAARLEIRSSFEELLPSDVPSVREIKQLVKRVGGDGTVFVNVQWDGSPEGMAAAKALAPKLAQDYLAMGPREIRAVEWNVAPVERWYADHWPLFLELADIQKAHDRLVEELGKAKAEVNPLLDLGLDDAVATSGGPPVDVKGVELLDPAKPMPREEVAKRFAQYSDGFMVSQNGPSLLLVVRPAGTSLGVAEARALLDRMRTVAERHRAELDAHHLKLGYAGSFPTFVAEYEAIIGDVFSTFFACVAVILASLVIFFRDLRSMATLGLAVLCGVAVTFGVTWLVIGYLNTQTAFLGAIVVGNGINYGLIYLARVGQLRRQGVALAEACHEGAREAFSATLLASLGTAVSFGTLIVAANRGFRHFGFIGGLGMLLCWAATFALLPALLTLVEKVRPFRRRAKGDFLPGRVRVLERIFARPGLIAAAFAVLTVASLALFALRSPQMMERNLDNLTNEMKGNDELRQQNRLANSGLGKSSASVLALLPDRNVADGYCDVIRARQKDPRWSDLIEGCDTASSVVPRQQPEKLALLSDVARRLTDRVLDRLPPPQAARARAIRADLLAQRPVTDADAPSSLLDRFRERDGTVGGIAVITARPGAHLELEPSMRRFVEAVRNVPVGGRTYDASGETVIFADLLSNIEREGPLTTGLSFLGVCLLVVLFFRRARASARVLVSLAVGVVLMVGVASATGLKINFFNFIAYPITFGIAVDYGANVAARMSARRSVLPALAEVGPAVALCSWTTIVGYGSLLFSINRALRSFGWYAMLGELTCLLAALVLLPAMRLLFAHVPEEGEGA